MNITHQQTEELLLLTLNERRQPYSGSEINYFLSKEYFAHKHRQKIMTARTLTELEIEDGTNS